VVLLPSVAPDPSVAASFSRSTRPSAVPRSASVLFTSQAAGAETRRRSASGVPHAHEVGASAITRAGAHFELLVERVGEVFRLRDRSNRPARRV